MLFAEASLKKVSTRWALPLAATVAACSLIIGCASAPSDGASASDHNVFSDNSLSTEMFSREGFHIQLPDRQYRPYWFRADAIPRVVPLDGSVPGKQLDQALVLIVERDGERFYHPTSLAQHGLSALTAYDETGQPQYLDIAEANANKLLDESIRMGDEIWFPYQFDYDMYEDPAMHLEAPWWSGMAQGQALSLICRLCLATDLEEYCSAANGIFATYVSLDANTPTFTRVNPEGHLWFEEYVGDGVEPNQVVNGHIYALFGLADYYWVTGSQEAEELFDGGATTILKEFPSFRLEGNTSYYCATDYCKVNDHRNPSYHRGVTKQLRQLGWLTGDTRFSRNADLLQEDWEAYAATLDEG